ncbi:MAG: hypothetical protein II776_04920, partial [Clostridia bacterium]|nr:hypothetical protein [Clostridia bacterium]
MIRSGLLRRLDGLLSKLGKSIYYQTKYGVKVLNRRGAASAPDRIGDAIELDPGTLLLPFDCLKDAYTFLGTGVADSPHLDLMRAALRGDPEHCRYVDLALAGALDGRDTTYVKPEIYLRECRKNREGFEEDRVKPIRY